MGYSYQDLDTRLKVLEDKLDFVMRMLPTPIASKTLDSKGQRQVKMVTMKDLYLLSKTSGLTPTVAAESAPAQRAGDEVI